LPSPAAHSHPFTERIAAALSARTPARAERDEPYKEAAVALVLVPRAPDDADLLLIRRATREGDPWSGQIGLPGGRFSPGDRSLEDAAIRETLEEVGLDLGHRGHVLGALDELRPRTPVLPPIIVRPIVAVVDSAPPLVLSEEVAEARWVRLSEIFRTDGRVRTEVVARNFRMQVEAYQVADFTIWGMTERILSAFEGLLR
jgi:8-oxo-dGTP pyrophosphatase MutT (NUDIX family)